MSSRIPLFGVRMDTEAVEAGETCVIIGRKFGPVQERNKRFNEMMESDWAGDVPRPYRLQKPSQPSLVGNYCQRKQGLSSVTSDTGL
jgi:hypothetical protein